MNDLRTRFGRNIRRHREARGLTQEALAAVARLDRSYVGGVERGERNPSLTAIGQLAAALQVPPASLFEGVDGNLSPAASAGTAVSVAERGGRLAIGFRYDQYDAEYLLEGARRTEYEEVRSTLKTGLASANSSANAVADAFLKAVACWPSANPSDLWTFIIGRIYCDPSNHPPANARLNLEQSWKRTSGWALERVLVRHYGKALKRLVISMETSSKARKNAFLGTIDDPRVVPDKVDVLLTYHADHTEKLLGVIHVKASIAERRTDDVPMSQALLEAGHLSVFWTMDSKSFPFGNTSEPWRIRRGRSRNRQPKAARLRGARSLFRLFLLQRQYHPNHKRERGGQDIRMQLQRSRRSFLEVPIGGPWCASVSMNPKSDCLLACISLLFAATACAGSISKPM